MSSLLIVKHELISSGYSCFNYPLVKDFYEHFNYKDMYESDKKKDSLFMLDEGKEEVEADE